MGLNVDRAIRSISLNADPACSGKAQKMDVVLFGILRDRGRETQFRHGGPIGGHNHLRVGGFEQRSGAVEISFVSAAHKNIAAQVFPPFTQQGLGEKTGIGHPQQPSARHVKSQHQSTIISHPMPILLAWIQDGHSNWEPTHSSGLQAERIAATESTIPRPICRRHGVQQLPHAGQSIVERPRLMERMENLLRIQCLNQ